MKLIKTILLSSLATSCYVFSNPAKIEEGVYSCKGRFNTQMEVKSTGTNSKVFSWKQIFKVHTYFNQMVEHPIELKLSYSDLKDEKATQLAIDTKGEIVASFQIEDGEGVYPEGPDSFEIKTGDLIPSKKVICPTCPNGQHHWDYTKHDYTTTVLKGFTFHRYSENHGYHTSFCEKVDE